MKKQPANPNVICPKCGGAKGNGKKLCRDCSHNGHKRSNRIQQLIVGLANGKMLKEIACEWNLSVSAVEYHWAQAKAKYGFQSYIDAVLYAVANGLVEIKQVVRRQRS